MSASEKQPQPSPRRRDTERLARKEQGTERLPDGRKIPYVRHCYPEEDYVLTIYGSHDASDHAKGISLLVKHERRGKARWDPVVNGLEIRRGEASSVLQGAWGKPETTNLYFAVEGVRLAFEQGIHGAIAFYFRNRTEFGAGKNVFTLLDYFTRRNNISPDTLQIMQDVFQAIQKENPGMIYPSPIHDTVLRAIQTGNPRGIRLLAKCIVAVDKNRKKKGTKRQKIADAVYAAANKHSRIPTWREIQDGRLLRKRKSRPSRSCARFRSRVCHLRPKRACCGAQTPVKPGLDHHRFTARKRPGTAT